MREKIFFFKKKYSHELATGATHTGRTRPTEIVTHGHNLIEPHQQPRKRASHAPDHAHNAPLFPDYKYFVFEAHFLSHFQQNTPDNLSVP